MYKILIIEDEPITAETTKQKLTNAGFDVSVAHFAPQGIELAFKLKPDLIILDLILLPSGSGLTVFEELKSFTETQAIPIVILSGAADSALKKDLLQNGVQRCLQKPCSEDDLINTVVEVLNNKNNIIDIEKVRFQVGGEKEMLDKVRALYSESYKKNLKKIRDCIRQKDVKEIEFMAHNIKGMVSNFGAKFAFELAQSLEGTAKTGDLERIEDIFCKLERELKKLETKLGEIKI